MRNEFTAYHPLQILKLLLIEDLLAVAYFAIIPVVLEELFG